LKRPDIIWDYDGTILPFSPYDSEQFFLDYLSRKNIRGYSFLKKIVGRAAIYADKKELLGHSFKKYYNWLVKDVDSSVLDDVNSALAEIIPDSYVETFAALFNCGFKMFIISCGTGDLCINPLEKKNAARFFSRVISNFFTYSGNKISGMDYHVLKRQDKIGHAVKLGCDPGNTVVVGDGYTDLPLLDWCRYPVLIDPGGVKRKKLSDKKYIFAESLPEVIEIIERYGVC
jgi:phosphoserine phosphatase